MPRYEGQQLHVSHLGSPAGSGIEKAAPTPGVSIATCAAPVVATIRHASAWCMAHVAQHRGPFRNHHYPRPSTKAILALTGWLVGTEVAGDRNECILE